MIPEPKPATDPDEPLAPELDRHLSDPAEKTEEVSGEQDAAAKRSETPTEPGTSTENQPT